MGGSKLFYVKNGVIFTMIFLEIRVYVAPFFVYNSPCISKQEPANQTRLASVTHYVEIFVEKRWSLKSDLCISE